MIELPKEVTGPEREVPASMILFGLPKSGKTTAVATLPNSLIIDTERGSKYVTGRKISPSEDTKPVALFRWVSEVAKSIKEQGRPYDFVAIDTASYLDEMSEWVGTYNYMKTNQGKTFNRYTQNNSPKPELIGSMIPFDDPLYDSVHSIGEGYGYRHSRKAMTDLLDECKSLGKICTIFICHVKDKYVISKQSNTEVRTMDLSLTGKVKDIYARDVDAIGYLWTKNGKTQISFKGNEDRIGGIRGSNGLQGYEGDLNWNQIFKLD